MIVWWTLLALAGGLATDAAAVAIAAAIRARQVPLLGGFTFASWCALFQGAMPVIGYATATMLGSWFAVVDHWIAFIVLAGIGVKLAIEGLKAEADAPASPWPSVRMQVSLALATSIDALVAGVTLPALGLGILWPALIIGGVTLLAVLLGAFFGRHLGVRIGRRAEVVGGVLLVLIGTRILISHLMV
ncbi:MAG TPA: manganese efflux pump MntP family protein [Planctomycetota bacterium]|nr:manganese efflux pump MntP family protein [Planctomycetota bacterium]